MTRDEEYALAMRRFILTGKCWVITFNKLNKPYRIGFMYAQEAVEHYEHAMNDGKCKDVKLEYTYGNHIN